MVQAELPPLAKRSHLLGRFAPGNVSTALASPATASVWVVMRAKDIGTSSASGQFKSNGVLTYVPRVGRSDFLCQRRTATAVHTASTTPNGHAPCKNP
jgi:hypothetical protein